MALNLGPSDYGERKSQHRSKDVEQQNYGNGSWLVRRTSFTIESTPANDGRASEQADRVSMTSSARSDEKRRLRNVLARWGNQRVEEIPSDAKSETSSAPFDAASQYGTTVSIEAGCSSRPRAQRHHSMKGLEQAASMSRWSGTGQPADAWGKLAKDPELWDDAGDTLVYFGYQRPEASFRIKSSMLENTKSDVLIGKLRNGFRPATKPNSLYSPGLLRGMKNLGVDARKKGSAGVQQSKETPIQYEIHFPASDNISKMDLLRYHTTTRNFFALLLDKPLVGMTHFQALMDLFERVKLYMPPDCNPCEKMVKFLLQNRLHIVANDPGAAAGLLAWSEDEEVRWQEGWREAFVHCVGMYGQVQRRPEYRDISNSTCVLLNHAHMELQARIQEAEHRLTMFNFDDLWGPATMGRVSDARKSYDRLRQALKTHYESQHKHWPPREPQESGSSWLNRLLVMQLQRDFAALYDAYVDRIQEALGFAAGNQCNRNCIANSNAPVSGERQIILAKVLASWDHKHKYAHIPKSLPRLPATLADDAKAKLTRPGLFTSKSKVLEKHAVQAYEEAGNIEARIGLVPNPLVERFRQLEKTDRPGDLDPIEARKGRWTLIYGVLQILATISVDTPHLYFTENVSYFLNPRLKGTPPWELVKDHVFEEASPLDSHCWTVAKLGSKPVGWIS